jgi:hypothetical protein
VVSFLHCGKSDSILLSPFRTELLKINRIIRGKRSADTSLLDQGIGRCEPPTLVGAQQSGRMER